MLYDVLNLFLFSKRYERSIRKLRRFVYHQTNNERADLIGSIQKLRQGNMNSSIIVVGNCKHETALARNVDKFGSLPVDYGKALHVKTIIDKPKITINEIAPGFLKDNNLRIVYESLKVKLFFKQIYMFFFFFL